MLANNMKEILKIRFDKFVRIMNSNSIANTHLYLAIIIFCLTVYTLFYIKGEVMSISSELYEVKKQVELEESSLRVLKAEFAYLSSPKRLSKLNENFLKLEKINITQIAHNPLSDKRFTAETKVAESVKYYRSKKWNFKKAPQKYIMQASYEVKKKR